VLTSRPVVAQILPTPSSLGQASAKYKVPEQNSVKTSGPILASQTTKKEQMVLRAYRISQPLNIDGVIDEPFYEQIDPISDFTQTLPEENGRPSELTELWIGFDDQNVYVSAKIWNCPLRRRMVP
jgi:hypothetical protein